MRYAILLSLLLFTDSVSAQWGFKLDLERQIREKVEEVDNAICNLNERLDSLQRRIEQLEKGLPQPTKSPEPKAELKTEPKAEPKPEAKKSVSKITCYTSEEDGDCKWCDLVRKDGLQAIYEKAGWEWVNVVDESGQSIPRFVVCHGGSCTTIKGYFNGNSTSDRVSAFHTAVKRIMVKDFQTDQKTRRWMFVVPDSYMSKWTYPGDIRDHLVQDHGIPSIVGMSKEDCERLHDALHEAGNP